MENQLITDVYNELILTGKETRFSPEMYGFVLASLDYHRSKVQQEGHIDAMELVESVIELAIMKFGPMSISVLKNWGVTETIHIGSIVYNLIAMEILSKTEEDTHEQFMSDRAISTRIREVDSIAINKKRIKSFKDA